MTRGIVASCALVEVDARSSLRDVPRGEKPEERVAKGLPPERRLPQVSEPLRPRTPATYLLPGRIYELITKDEGGRFYAANLSQWYLLGLDDERSFVVHEDGAVVEMTEGARDRPRTLDDFDDTDKQVGRCAECGQVRDYGHDEICPGP